MLIITARKESQLNPHLLTLFFSLLALNISEALTVIFHNNISIGYYILIAYYVSAIFVFTCLLNLTLSLFVKKKILIFTNTSLVIPFITLLFFEFTIAGVEPIYYSFTRIQGDYYFLITAYLQSLVISTACILIYFGFYKNNNQARSILYCVQPLLIGLIVVIAFLNTGHNALFVGSTLSTLSMLLLVATQSKNRLLKIKLLLPWTTEYRERKVLKQMLYQAHYKIITQEICDIREVTKETQDLLISKAINLNEEEATKVSKLINIPYSTLRKKYMK